MMFKLSNGVSQGWVLSPKLFVIYIIIFITLSQLFASCKSDSYINDNGINYEQKLRINKIFYTKYRKLTGVYQRTELHVIHNMFNLYYIRNFIEYYNLDAWFDCHTCKHIYVACTYGVQTTPYPLLCQQSCSN